MVDLVLGLVLGGEEEVIWAIGGGEEEEVIWVIGLKVAGDG